VTNREKALLFRNKIRNGAMPEEMFVAQLAGMLDEVAAEAVMTSARVSDQFYEVLLDVLKVLDLDLSPESQVQMMAEAAREGLKIVKAQPATKVEPEAKSSSEVLGRYDAEKWKDMPAIDWKLERWRIERDACVERLRAAPFYKGRRAVSGNEDWKEPGRGHPLTPGPNSWDAEILAGVISMLPDLHPFPKFTVPGEAKAEEVDYANSPLQELIRACPTNDIWPVNRVPALAKSCTCGAAACGTRIHSDYCDLHE
jgi:hypothetical protein